MGLEEDVLRKYKTVAVVGLSSNPERPSHRVARYLKEQGYRIIPVNPRETQVLGEKAYPDLCAVPDPIEVVDIFREAKAVPRVVAQAMYVGAKAVWMQEGIISPEAFTQATQGGLRAVMDRCIYKELMARGG